MQLPQPQYINLEYFFNSFSALIYWLLQKIVIIFSWFQTGVYRDIAVVVSVGLVVFMVVIIVKTINLNKKRGLSYVPFVVSQGGMKIRADRWDKVEQRMASINPAEWKLAIIEADAIIDDITKKIGYKGENLGERLKNIEPSDLDNLQNIWEAHKVRNRIAHGDAIGFTQKDAKDAIDKYKKALKELKYI